MIDNEKTVREFVAGWSNLNTDELVAYFTEEGVYHNIPAQPLGKIQDT
jgi:limonene-1,2-epoxide hydrolase